MRGDNFTDFLARVGCTICSIVTNRLILVISLSLAHPHLSVRNISELKAFQFSAVNGDIIFRPLHLMNRCVRYKNQYDIKYIKITMITSGRNA